MLDDFVSTLHRGGWGFQTFVTEVVGGYCNKEILGLDGSQSHRKVLQTSSKYQRKLFLLFITQTVDLPRSCSPSLRFALFSFLSFFWRKAATEKNFKLLTLQSINLKRGGGGGGRDSYQKDGGCSSEILKRNAS